MIKVRYKNKELEGLIERGVSRTFQHIVSKKPFMQAIYEFCSLLNIIDNIEELRYYRFLAYQRNTGCSSVIIDGSRLIGDLMFFEEEEGKSITLYDLIINSNYGKEKDI